MTMLNLHIQKINSQKYVVCCFAFDRSCIFSCYVGQHVIQHTNTSITEHIQYSTYEMESAVITDINAYKERPSALKISRIC